MGNLNAVAQGDLALASVVVTAGVPAFGVSRGFSGLVDNGIGDYSLTLDQAQALNTAGIVMATINGVAPAEISVEVVSPTSVRVRVLNNAGAPVDSSFWIRITPVSPQ